MAPVILAVCANVNFGHASVITAKKTSRDTHEKYFDSTVPPLRPNRVALPASHTRVERILIRRTPCSSRTKPREYATSEVKVCGIKGLITKHTVLEPSVPQDSQIHTNPH